VTSAPESCANGDPRSADTLAASDDRLISVAESFFERNAIVLAGPPDHVEKRN
jgi:hypothetical protein